MGTLTITRTATEESHAVGLTLPLAKDMEQKAELSGHVGTHFEVMVSIAPTVKSDATGIPCRVSARTI